MKPKIKILSAFVALVLSMLACSVFSTGPGKTVQNFFNALEGGKIQEAKSYLSNHTLQSLGTDKWDSVLTQMSQAINTKGGINKLDITEENVNGDIAKVSVQISFGNDTQETSVLDLIKENNKWKLELNTSLK